MAKSKKSNKNTAKRIAPIGYWVSGVALLATIILLLFKILAVGGLYTVAKPQNINLFLLIAAGLVVIGLAFFALLDPQRVREMLTGRQARYGSNAAIVLLATIGILIIVNLIVFQNPVKPLDLTEDKSNSLSHETTVVLGALPESVHATAFFTKNYPSDTAKKLLDNYKSASAGKFDYTFVDPDQNPLPAQQAGISGDGKIYLQMGNRHEIVASADEQDITAALDRLMNPGQYTVYFLTGHGERDIQTASDTSYTNVKSALEAKNYTVKALNLIATNKIPDDAKSIIIAGPQQPVTSAEVALLQAYAAKGGTLVVLEEPTPVTQFGTAPDPLADYLATTWGITLDNDFIIDTNSSQPEVAIANSYGSHAITDKLQGMFSFYPTARSLSVTQGATIQPVALVATASAAWGETDFAALLKAMQGSGQIGFNSGSDIPGPMIIGMAAEDSQTNGKVAVFGDSDFATNKYFSQYANGDMLINSIDWAVGESNITLSAPTSITRTMSPVSGLVLALIALAFVIVLPGLVIAGGVASWLVRRSRG